MPEHFLANLRELSPHTVISVLTDDRHGFRQQQMAQIHNSAILAESATDYLERETAVYRAVDLILVIAKAEREAVQMVAPHTPVFLIPFAVPAQTTIAPLSQRSGILFLGNFLNAAAQDAATWFLRDSWTKVTQRLTDARLTLVGTFSKELLPFPPAGVDCLGHVASLSGIFNSHRVSVSPVRFGTGISTRNILSMSYGVPVVTTQCGAHSLNAENGSAFFSCETADDITMALTALYTDDSLWQQMSDAARDCVAEHFSLLSLKAAIKEFISAACPQTLQTNSMPVFSAKMIDNIYPDLKTCNGWGPAHQRRIAAYIALGETFLQDNEYGAALRQFRHACSLVQIQKHPEWLSRIVHGLESCYRGGGPIELGVDAAPILFEEVKN